MSMPEITQRDLRSKSREIMDAVEHGQGFTVTRDGHQIGELIPIRRGRRFVSRQEFAATSRNAPAGNLDAFRADQDATADHHENRKDRLFPGQATTSGRAAGEDRSRVVQTSRSRVTARSSTSAGWV